MAAIEKTSFIILGGGITGLTLGWKLAESGHKTAILESASLPGGLAGTVREDGYSLDFGPHSFFSEDAEIRRLVLELFEGNLKAKPRRVKFNYRGRMMDYPFTVSSVLFQMGPAAAAAVLFDFIRAKIFPTHISSDIESLNVEEWALSRFGRHLYQTFFKPYTEQFWQIPCSELSARSIPTHTRLSFTKALKLLIQKRLSAGLNTQIEREKLPTYYPDTGYGEIAERVARNFLKAGGHLHLSSRVISVERLQPGILKVCFSFQNKTLEMEAGTIVSTLPVPVFIPMVKPSLSPAVLDSAAKLDYRPLLMLGMATKKQNALEADYIYMLDRPYNRIVEMNKFSSATSPDGKNIVAVEIPALQSSPVWKENKEQLFERCIPALESDGILKRQDVERLFLVKSAYAYPIYRKDYHIHLKRVLEAIDAIPDLFVLGRSGEFRYMDADQCMRRALNLSVRLQGIAV